MAKKGLKKALGGVRRRRRHLPPLASTISGVVRALAKSKFCQFGAHQAQIKFV
jgi:hypothetical protein